LKEKSGLLAGFFFALYVVTENPTGILFKTGRCPVLFARVTRALRSKKFKHKHKLAAKDDKRTLFFCLSASATKSGCGRGLVIDMSCCM
jgi:hypothetical protein